MKGPDRRNAMHCPSSRRSPVDTRCQCGTCRASDIAGTSAQPGHVSAPRTGEFSFPDDLLSRESAIESIARVSPRPDVRGSSLVGDNRRLPDPPYEWEPTLKSPRRPLRSDVPLGAPQGSWQPQGVLDRAPAPCDLPSVATPFPEFSLGCDTPAWTDCEKRVVLNGLNYARKAALAVVPYLEFWKATSAKNVWASRSGVTRQYFGGYDYQKYFGGLYRVTVLDRIWLICRSILNVRQKFRKIGHYTGKCAECCDCCDMGNACTFWGVIKFCPGFRTNNAFLTPCRAARLILHEVAHKIGIDNLHPGKGLTGSLNLAVASGDEYKKTHRNPDSYAWFFLHLLHNPDGNLLGAKVAEDAGCT